MSVIVNDMFVKSITCYFMQGVHDLRFLAVIILVSFALNYLLNEIPNIIFCWYRLQFVSISVLVDIWQVRQIFYPLCVSIIVLIQSLQIHNLKTPKLRGIDFTKFDLERKTRKCIILLHIPDCSDNLFLFFWIDFIFVNFEDSIVSFEIVAEGMNLIDIVV